MSVEERLNKRNVVGADKWSLKTGTVTRKNDGLVHQREYGVKRNEDGDEIYEDNNNHHMEYDYDLLPNQKPLVLDVIEKYWKFVFEDWASSKIDARGLIERLQAGMDLSEGERKLGTSYNVILDVVKDSNVSIPLSSYHYRNGKVETFDNKNHECFWTTLAQNLFLDNTAPNTVLSSIPPSGATVAAYNPNIVCSTTFIQNRVEKGKEEGERKSEVSEKSISQYKLTYSVLHNHIEDLIQYQGPSEYCYGNHDWGIYYDMATTGTPLHALACHVGYFADTFIEGQDDITNMSADDISQLSKEEFPNALMDYLNSLPDFTLSPRWDKMAEELCPIIEHGLHNEQTRQLALANDVQNNNSSMRP